MAASNDVRGWVMSAVSGVACVLGASIVCVDILLHHFSHEKSFQIVHSNGFLSASLCLSAGVMLFTSLYSMLPEAKEYLVRAGFSPSAAAYSLIALFLAGVIIIRFLSVLLHNYIPSHVVDCAHTHDTHATPDPEMGEEHHHTHPPEPNIPSSERTPLLTRSFKSTATGVPLARSDEQSFTAPRSEPLRTRLVRRVTRIMGGVKAHCDEDGPCYGFSQACGNECAKTLVDHDAPRTVDVVSRPPVHQTRSHPPPLISGQPTALDADAPSSYQPVHEQQTSSASSQTGRPDDSSPEDESLMAKSQHHVSGQHHHHVPQNAFLSIGLQTSVAIALHKLPEGFITYATNHASPTLGLTVFLALFIHNISEGFVMALPLYLALHSRGKAMFWSSVLGGISQPAGAGLAALWIWSTQQGGTPGDATSNSSWGVYGGMFAATAGVMTSVALQLFSEGLSLTHNRGVCMGFAIGGMGLMGLSFALTA